MRSELEKAFLAIVNKDEETASKFFESFLLSKQQEVRKDMGIEDGEEIEDVDDIIDEAQTELETNKYVPDEYRNLEWYETKDWFYSILPTGQLALSSNGEDYVVTDDPVLDFPKAEVKDDYFGIVFDKKDSVMQVNEPINLNTIVDVTGYEDTEWVDTDKETVNFAETEPEKGLTEADIMEWEAPDHSDVSYTIIRPQHFYLKFKDEMVEVFVEDDNEVFDATAEQLQELFDKAVDENQFINLTPYPDDLEVNDEPESESTESDAERKENDLESELDALVKDYEEINGMDKDDEEEKADSEQSDTHEEK